MSCIYCEWQTDYGLEPYVANIQQMAVENENFRIAIWTGKYLQMTLMSILPREEIGMEIHENLDQFVRVEQGMAFVEMKRKGKQRNFQQKMRQGDGVFIPAGTWHNIINIGEKELKLSSIYAPPNHPMGTIHPTKEDAKRAEK